jgi:C4-dicarboxylate-specific signal transduction histidine kinase
MNNSFNNRMDAQREFLKIVNSRRAEVEPLLALSSGAIDRWVAANRMAQEDNLVALVRKAGDALFFLANKSQEQVSMEYKQASGDFAALVEQARQETNRPLIGSRVETWTSPA